MPGNCWARWLARHQLAQRLDRRIASRWRSVVPPQTPTSCAPAATAYSRHSSITAHFEHTCWARRLKFGAKKISLPALRQAALSCQSSCADGPTCSSSTTAVPSCARRSRRSQAPRPPGNLFPRRSMSMRRCDHLIKKRTRRRRVHHAPRPWPWHVGALRCPRGRQLVTLRASSLIRRHPAVHGATHRASAGWLSVHAPRCAE